ncbi:ermin-like [Brachionichthys hirsutus]|uniref:ermin-like n=1 Tax=Brachionichthys hirsutus TaxID=412623 RepID=UPI0036051435
MEMQMSRITEEEAVTCQVRGITGGVTGEALQTPEESERDDSVFLSDEDQAHLDINENSSWDFEHPEPRDESDVSAHREADLQMLPEQNASEEKANRPAEEEDLFDTQEEKPPFDTLNEEKTKRLSVEADTERQVSGHGKRQIDQQPKTDHDIPTPVEFHHISSPGYATLPLLIKDDQQKSFNHLTSSKYSTVSYRRIRQGNTQQKIDKFEYMMNL